MKAFSDFINESKLEDLGAIGVTFKSADIKDTIIISSTPSSADNSVIVELGVTSLTGDQLMILVKGGLKQLESTNKGLKLKF